MIVSFELKRLPVNSVCARGARRQLWIDSRPCCGPDAESGVILRFYGAGKCKAEGSAFLVGDPEAYGLEGPAGLPAGARPHLF